MDRPTSHAIVPGAISYFTLDAYRSYILKKFREKKSKLKKAEVGWNLRMTPTWPDGVKPLRLCKFQKLSNRSIHHAVERK